MDTLPIFVGLFPFAILGGFTLSKFGRYKPIHLSSFALLTISFGLFSLLGPESSTAAWACFQLLCAVGSGISIATLLPAMQAPLDETLVAASTGVWTFVRGFGTVWGVTIPSAVFNNECRINAGDVHNGTLAAYLGGGRAFQYATQAFVEGISDPESQNQVVHVFSKVCCILGLVICLLLRMTDVLVVSAHSVVCWRCLCRDRFSFDIDREGNRATDQAEHQVRHRRENKTW